MTRAATAPEITKLASGGQWSDVLAFISNPATVLACRVNEATPVNDKRTTITFDGTTSGGYAAALEGMTVLVGSAAGLSDRGIGCTNAASTATVLTIIKTSNIAIADNDYITVLQDFGVWAKRDLPTYSNQLTVRKPTIVAGGDRMLELTGANVAAVYALSGAATYVTTCAGATVTDGTTDHPTVTITTAGEYMVKIVATAANTAASTTYRIIYVHDAAHPPKNIVLDGNSADANGWSASLQLYENQSAVRDRAKVVVFARDYYANVLGSIGSLAGCENVVTLGWIAGDSISYDVDGGGVAFEIQPAGWWLDQQENPDEVAVAGTAAANWVHMASLTADMMLWLLLEWYTTALNSMDAIYTGDTRTTVKMAAPAGSLWSQIGSIAGRIGCIPFVNQYGQIIFAIDTPLIPIADRATIPVVVTLTSADFASVDIEKVITQPTAQTVITGELSTGRIICSLGGGHTPAPYGTIANLDGLMAVDQAQLNVLAGSFYARDNMPYKFSITDLRGNNRLIEPGNRVGLTLTGTDNLRGISYAGNIIVRSVDRSHDPETGAWSISLDADAETQAGLYATGEVPITTDTGLITTIIFPDQPPIPGIIMPPQPPEPPPITASTCADDSPATGPYPMAWTRPFVDGAGGTTSSSIAWKRCTLRSATAANKTYIIFWISNTGLAIDHLNVYAIDSTGARLETAVVTRESEYQPGYQTDMRATFSPVSPVNVDGFEVVCDEGLDTISSGVRSISATAWQKISFYGTTIAISEVQTVLDVANGQIGYDLTLTGEDTNLSAGAAWRLRTSWDLDPAIWDFYCQFRYTIVGPQPLRRLIWSYRFGSATTYPGATSGSYSSLELLKTGYNSNGFYERYCDMDFEIVCDPSTPQFTASIGLLFMAVLTGSPPPARSAGLGTTNLYNVCPTVAA